MCDCEYDQPDVFEQSDVKARKFHRCSECRGWIAPGETYRKSFGVWDGSAQSFKTCRDCIEFAGWAEDQNGDSICYGFGNMIHDISDCLDEMGDDRVQAEMSMRWQELRRKRRAVGISA